MPGEDVPVSGGRAADKHVVMLEYLLPGQLLVSVPVSPANEVFRLRVRVIKIIGDYPGLDLLEGHEAVLVRVPLRPEHFPLTSDPLRLRVLSHLSLVKTF